MESLAGADAGEGRLGHCYCGGSLLPTYAKEVYDVTGAGDTVISVFTLAKAAGATWEEAAKIANAAGGIVVGKIGTSTVSEKELIETYNSIYSNN